MIKTFCDHCGKDVTRSGSTHIHVERGLFSGMYNLCTNCAENLRTFLKKYGDEESEKANLEMLERLRELRSNGADS